MKLKERKENKFEKEVKPVKKSVALVLTIVTVFAFAAACFSLGFCSGKKVNEAYAAISGQFYFYMSDTIKRPSQDYAAIFASGGVDYTSMWENSDGYLCYTNSSSTVQVYNYNTNKWVNEKFRYLYVHGTNSDEFFQFFTSQSIMPEMDPAFYSGIFTMKSAVSFSAVYTYDFTFSSGGTGYSEMKTLSSGAVYYYYASGNSDRAYSTSSGWVKSDYRYITVSSTASNVCNQPDYMAFMANVDSFSTSSEPEPVLYTCTLSENTSGMYSFGFIEGDGVTYDENAETIKGPADSYFQIQLMPFEGYMVDTFLLTASNGYPKSIVRNSDTLYTVTFEEDDFTLNISATVKPITYTLTIQFEGEGFTHTATPTGTSEKISDDVFECDVGSGAYVAIDTQKGYIIEEISYNVDSGVATIQESGINGYRVLRNSGNAVVTFTVTTKTDSVVVPSGYYWLRAFSSHPDFPTRYTISGGDFQAIRSIENGSIVWESLVGFIPYDKYSPWFYFKSAPSVRVQVFKYGNYRVNGVPSGVDNPFPSPVALYYPVIYVPKDIKESRGYSSTLISFMTGGVYAYKSDVQYYNAFYVELPSTQASIPTSLPSGLDGLTLYTPSQNTLISPQSLSLSNMNNGVIGYWTIYYVVDFAGDPDRGEYTGAWFGIQGGQKRSVYNQSNPFYADGNIYINSTVMPTSVYSFLNSAFNISAVPIDVDPPPADYWIGLDAVLSYQIFGIPLSVLLAVVISSVFVVVVIRLFAGG